MTQLPIWKKATSSISLILIGGGIALGGNYLVNSPESWAKENNAPEVPTSATSPDATLAQLAQLLFPKTM